MRPHLLLLTTLLCLRSVAYAADEPSVTAVLTSSKTFVGQPVQLQIKVTGARGATPPAEIAVDGLDIRYSGQSQLMEGRNFQFSYSVVFNYTVMPLSAGTFRIPPQAINVAGKTVRTPELMLNVSDGGGRAGRRSRGGTTAPLHEKQLGLAELIVAKKNAYVGEMVPVVIRLGFHAVTHASLTDGPHLTGQGFTTQKLSQPQQGLETIDGKTYQVLTYKTAMAAARSGAFEVGPVEAKVLVQVPRRRGGGGGARSPFDMFGMNDPFPDPFFIDPFGPLPEQREIALRSDSVSLEVKPLPANAPPEFTGAVGVFKMTADVKPKRAQVGDPLTVTAEISGRGNFDRVDAPALMDERGCHKYPPSSSFKQDDDIGISGVKSFELVLTPNERKEAVPPLLFAFFDPVKETYVTLRSEQLPVAVEGNAAAAAPAQAAAPAAAPSAAPSVTPGPTEQDILYQLTEPPKWGASFTPVYLRPRFWALQTVPLVALLALIGWKLRQARAHDREARRRTALHHEFSELVRKLRREDVPAPEYFAGAARAVQLKTALARNVEPHAVDAEVVAGAFPLDEQKRTELRELFRQRDELRYSGAHNGDSTLSPERRRAVLELVDSLS